MVECTTSLLPSFNEDIHPVLYFFRTFFSLSRLDNFLAQDVIYPPSLSSTVLYFDVPSVDRCYVHSHQCVSNHRLELLLY